MGDTLAGCCGCTPTTTTTTGTDSPVAREGSAESGSVLSLVRTTTQTGDGDQSNIQSSENESKNESDDQGKKDRLVSKEALSRARLDKMEKLIDALSAMDDIELPMELVRMIMRFSSAAVYTWDRKRTFFLDIRGNTVRNNSETGMVGWSVLNHAWSKKHKPKVFGIICTKLEGKIRVGVSESTNAVGAAYKVVAVHSNKNPVTAGTQIFCQVDLDKGIFRVQTGDMMYDRSMEFKSEVGYPVHGMVILHPGSAVTLLDIDPEQQEQIALEKKAEEEEKQKHEVDSSVQPSSSILPSLNLIGF